MRITTGIISLAIWSASVAQVTFYGEAEPVGSLNKPSGQNYLVISPHQYQMAFTEEYGGNVELEVFHFEKHPINGNEWAVARIIDRLNEEGVITPIGYDQSGGLYISEVKKELGIFRGAVKYLSKDGDINAVTIPYFKNKSVFQSGAISKDGQYMILSLEGYFSYGVEDLYVVKKLDDGSWESVTNLGRDLNSKFQETTPFLATDNKTLFFASNREGGAGSFDIYVSERLDDSWRSWTEPKNLADINTTGSETSFCFSGLDPYAYFVRSSNSDGYGEIMQIRINDDIVEDTTYREVFNDLEERTYFKIVDIVSEQRIPAEVIVLEDTTRLQSAFGIFKVDSLKGKTLEFKSKGYLSAIVKINEEVKPGENIVALEPLLVGKTIALKDVLFERASSNILPSSKDQLNLVFEMMQENPKIKILLKGHTDNRGNPESNKKLSQERVDVVKAYLKFMGIDEDRIEGIGYGGEQPIASNETEDTRRLNRRVEFEIVEY